MPSESLLELLLELQILDRVPRMGWLLRGVADPESVSEHAFHVALLTWVLAPGIPGVDRERAVAMALLHDAAEVRLGDLPRTAASYLPADAKRQAETAATEQLLAPLPEAIELAADYHGGRSPEARLVKACDKLQLLLKVRRYERDGAGGLAEFWENPDNFPGTDLPPVRELIDELMRGRDERSD